MHDINMEIYEKAMFLINIYRKLEEEERSIRSNDVMDGFDSLQAIRKKKPLFT